jgi:hypothetical protein
MDYKTFFGRRADEVDALAHQILKANKPNDYV